ncbi:MmcQ/YjbR family DNA-binding protein [Nonomuraea africana]|uniref:MmcQ/YjbR family DNA-binding protein n=1 Tax=Nonomuraea africana TaxID=46171 RepID=UPI0033C391F7
MTTLAQLRKTALSLPETAEQAIRFGMVAFTVRDKRFASIGKDNHVQLRLPAEEADEVLAAHPTAERLTRGSTSIGVRVPLGHINGQQLNHWVRRAWLARAPKRLAEQVTAGDAAVPGEAGDLPKAIGRPATQALISAGRTTLTQVAELTEAELLAMHGVGPKAVRTLSEALSATGRRLKA